MTDLTDHPPACVTDSRPANLPAWVGFAGYVVFVFGFSPVALISLADLTPSDPTDTALRVALTCVIIMGPALAFFGTGNSAFRFVGKGIAELMLTLVGVTLAAALLYTAILMVAGTRADTLVALMWCAGLGALGVLFWRARHRTRPIAARWAVCASVVLLLCGGWSILSGITMSQQAERLAGGQPYKIILRRSGVVFLRDPTWWQLRGSKVLAPNSQGDNHTLFYAHAVLETAANGRRYTWSKTSMRFDPVRPQQGDATATQD